MIVTMIHISANTINLVLRYLGHHQVKTSKLSNIIFSRMLPRGFEMNLKIKCLEKQYSISSTVTSKLVIKITSNSYYFCN